MWLLHVHVFIGSAYQHKVLFGEGKPIWASNINCSGNEYRLADCPGFNPANVKMCTSRRDAGVVCYSNLGKYKFYFISFNARMQLWKKLLEYCTSFLKKYIISGCIGIELWKSSEFREFKLPPFT
jgi:hypothetical protein